MQSNPTFPLLTMHLSLHTMKGFASLFQHGLLVPVQQSIPVLPLLLALPGFTAEYLEKTVQTIFINGVAADSLDRQLPPGSTVALSAAMPGLAGAIFRRQGVHGSLRSRPMVRETVVVPNSGYLTVKLFNSIATDRAVDLLQRGILVRGASFFDFASRREKLFLPPTRWQLDARQSDWSSLLQTVQDVPILRVEAKEVAAA